MKYKKDIVDAEKIADELKECVEIIASTYLRMQEVR